MGQAVTPDELDRASAAGLVRLGWANRRPVSCTNTACRRLVGVDGARHISIDGHWRGYLCRACEWGIPTPKGNGP